MSSFPSFFTLPWACSTMSLLQNSLPFFSFSHRTTPTLWFQLLLLCPAAAAMSLQSCLTPCSPIDGRPPGSSVSGILQARILEWVAISFSNAWKWRVKVKSLSCACLLATPWTAAYQAPPSMGFSHGFPHGKSTGVGCHCLLWHWSIEN